MKKYPKKVLEIHNEFNTAAEKLLQDANAVLQKAKQYNIDKLKRLEKLGFSKTREVVEGAEEMKAQLVSHEIANLVNNYQMHYPNNKFIAEKQVNQICEKYKLVCGNIKDYKGFVPEKNLQEIENFKGVKPEHNKFSFDVLTNVELSLSYEEYEKVVNHAIKNRHEFNITVNDRLRPNLGALLVDYKNKIGTFGIPSNTYPTIYSYQSYKTPSSNDLLICAPEKDMDTKGKTRLGFKLVDVFKTEIPDPVVLKPVIGGYLILTAWGDEASDELVVNQKFN